MAQKKYYVVWEGRKKGVLSTWDECAKSVNGFAGAKYKSFATLALAKEAFANKYEDYKGQTISAPTLSKEKLEKIGKPNMNSISVDAASSGNPGIMEYQGVETKTKKVLFKQGPFKESSNNMGEFLALVHALAYMKKNNDKRPIYTDSKIAMGWVKKKTANSKVKENDQNKEVFILMKRAENWLKENDFENKILKWETKAWGEIPADYGRK